MHDLSTEAAGQALRSVVEELASEGVDYPYHFHWSKFGNELHASANSSEPSFAVVTRGLDHILVKIHGRSYKVTKQPKTEFKTPIYPKPKVNRAIK